MSFRTIGKEKKKVIAAEIKMLLHASRNCLRNTGTNTQIIRFNSMDAYYGEAFGMMRPLVTFGFGYFGSSNLDAVKEEKSAHPEDNLRWWFDKLCDEVLEEEGYRKDNICEYCMERYGKDSREYNDAEREEKYFLSMAGVPGSKIEVSREKWIEAERGAGFRPKGGGNGPTTGGFSSDALSGSIETVWHTQKELANQVPT